MLKRAFGFVFHGFLLLLFVLAGLVILSFGHIPGGYRSYVVLSGSMVPAIQPGSLILVKPESKYAIGDIVTRATLDPKVTITHRIVEQTAGQLRTKGDANLAADAELFDDEEILGKVLWVIPKVGTVVNYAQTTQGFIVMVVVPSALIVLDEIINILSVIRKKREGSRTQLHRLKVL